MARVSGVDLPRDKRVDVALTYIYGVGSSRSSMILGQAQVDPSTRVKDLTEAEVVRVREFIDSNYRVEGDLRRQVSQDIKRLMDIGCYRGLRHRRGLPVHGQRTRTNARTCKGTKRTVAGRGRRRGMAKR